MLQHEVCISNNCLLHAWRDLLLLFSALAQEGFARLASMCFARGFKLYRLRPKFHLGCHIVLALDPGCGGEHSVNPVCYLVQGIHFVSNMLFCFGFFATLVDDTWYK